MEAELVFQELRGLDDGSFTEVVIWKVPARVRGSDHDYKYRLALVIDDVCVLRYDNEAGKGDHKHIGNDEVPYEFRDLMQLLADFHHDVYAMRFK